MGTTIIATFSEQNFNLCIEHAIEPWTGLEQSKRITKYAFRFCNISQTIQYQINMLAMEETELTRCEFAKRNGKTGNRLHVSKRANTPDEPALLNT